MSSRCSGCKPGTLSIAARIATAAMSSGRVADSFPFGALPTAVRTADTITAELIASIPQDFALLEQMLHSGQRLLFPAKRLEGLSFEVEEVLFGRSRCPRRIAAADDVCQFARDMGLIIGDVTGPSHQ